MTTLGVPRYAVAVATVFGLVAIARPSVATPNFPAALQQFVGSVAPPPCTTCHNNPNGGLGTVTTPFGQYLRSRGLIPNDTTSLRNALLAAQGENHDSNGDGVSDIDALREGLDPNGASGDPAQPGFGCSVHNSPRRMPSSAAVLCALLSVACLMRRARARRRRSTVVRAAHDSASNISVFFQATHFTARELD